MKVLVACEFTQIVCKAFRDKGHEAYSCDILPTEGNPDWHIQGDVLEILDDGWDMMIAHPPCTWLCQAMRTNAARKDRPNITPIFEKKREEAFQFVMDLYNADIRKVAIENPIGYLNSAWRKPDQVARPFMFGHKYKKDICLWLKNLPILLPTVALFPMPPYKKLDFWSTKRNIDGKSLKSKTFLGVAKAMADQWG